MNNILEDALKLHDMGLYILPCNSRPGDKKKAPYLQGWQKYDVIKDFNTVDNIENTWADWKYNKYCEYLDEHETEGPGKGTYCEYQYPFPNIAIPMGAINNILLFDLDNHDDTTGVVGSVSFKEWCSSKDISDELPLTWNETTGSGGQHYYFKLPQKYSKLGNHDGILPGVDIKCNGGCSVVSPSIHNMTGKPYTWEIAPFDEGYELAELPHNIEMLIDEKLAADECTKNTARDLSITDKITENRNSTLFSMGRSFLSKGHSAIQVSAFVHYLAKEYCEPPYGVDDAESKELERTIASILSKEPGHSKEWDQEHGILNTDKQTDLSSFLVSLDDVEQEEVSWLVPGIIPKGDITILSGDGGTGKGHIWVDLVSAISNGKPCFFSEEPFDCEPGKVFIFSSEDSVKKVIKGRFKNANANMKNIFTIPCESENFGSIKFNSDSFLNLIKAHKPTLCVLDPLQAFIPGDIQMSSRNAMRQCLNPLIAIGEETGTTFLIVCHTNKKTGVWGRSRLADSSDIWDIARSVLICGYTKDKGLRYLTHEKSSYSEEQRTTLFAITDTGIKYHGKTDKKDKDFVTEALAERSYTAPKRDNAKTCIIEIMHNNGGIVESKSLEAELHDAYSISKRTYTDARNELDAERGLITYKTGFQGGYKLLDVTTWLELNMQQCDTLPIEKLLNDMGCVDKTTMATKIRSTVDRLDGYRNIMLNDNKPGIALINAMT